MTHSILAPSSMARTVQCPGSVMLAAKYPEPDGPEAAEGTATHWGGLELCQRRAVGVGQVAPNGVALTDDMIERAELWAETVEPHVGVVLLEQRVPITRIHPKCWGTPDAIKWHSARHLQVYDYKDGFGFVDEFENWQCIAYAAGALEHAQIPPANDNAIRVDITIVQPRAYGHKPVRTWTTNAGDLRAHWNIAAAACEQALSDAPTLRVGPECKHCPARRACPAIQRAALEARDTAVQAVPLELTTAEAAEELRQLQYAQALLDARCSGLEAQLLAEARNGAQIPHYSIEFGSGRENWAVPAPAVIALGTLYGVDLQKPAVRTPKQARDAGVVVPAGLTKRDPGEAKLRLMKPHHAARIFGRTET